MKFRHLSHWGIIVLSGASLVVLMAIPVLAPPGDLDPTFDRDGKVATSLTGSSEGASDVAIQGDGKILAAGTTPGDDFGLVRYEIDGSLDTTFGGDGTVITDFAGDEDRFAAIALQADGKIVAAGHSFLAGSSYFAVARYNTDGSLDTTFDGDGKVITDFQNDGQANAVVVQADGKIVAAGNAFALGDFGVARYNTDGSLDTTFDGDGRVTTDFGGDVDEAFGVAIQGDGKIVAVGRVYIFSGGIQDFALARYNTDGSLDTTFNVDGKVTTDFSASENIASDVALQADGKIVVTGDAVISGSVDFALARYDTDGSLDTTFDGDGKVTTDFGLTERAAGMAIQGDGRIVSAGCYGCFTRHSDFALARYNSDGSLDTVFSSDGKITTDFFGNTDYAADVAIQDDGRIVAAGTVLRSSTGQSDFGLARYSICRGTSRRSSIPCR